MNKVESVQPYFEAIHKSIDVDLPPADAFDFFTRHFAAWWPSEIHSVSQDRVADVVFEGHRGGSIYEKRDDGQIYTWGHVVVWEPPHRFVMHWYPGRTADTAQEVEVQFNENNGGTRLTLEHRNWQSLGDKASQLHQQYDGGWDFVLNQYLAGIDGQ